MPTAALISGGLGAAGSIGSALIGSSAAKQASQQQVALGEQALTNQLQMFGEAKGALQPFITAGAGGIPQLQSTLSTLAALTNPGTSANALAMMPGFQFASQYGTMAAKNALTAQGLGASAGPVATAVSNYNTGLAGTQWQNTVNALVQAAQAGQGFVNTGANAAGALASGAITSGNNQASTLTGIGSSQAAGTLGSANALAGGLTGTTNALSSYALLSSPTIQNLLNGGNNPGMYSGSLPTGTFAQNFYQSAGGLQG